MIPFFTRPFNCFLLLVGLNSLLAYSPLTWPLKIAIGLLGLGIMGWFYVKNQTPSTPEEAPIYTREFFTPASWMVALALVLALAVRFYKLTSYLTFPIPDEVINAYNAIHMNNHWSWDAFYYSSQMPPFYIWLLACVFKFAGVSVFNLWLVPALLSFISILFFYESFREVTSRSISFVCLILLAVGFWPVFLGRFSHNAVLMVFWESLAFWLLAKYTKAKLTRNRIIFALALGVCLGAGFYTYYAWPLVVLWLFPAVWIISKHSGSKGKGLISLVLTAVFLTVLPLAIEALREGFGDYIKGIFHPGNLPERTILWDLSQNINYLTSFLWTGATRQFGYKPQWGGFLNPILGSLFLLGSVETILIRNLPEVKWLFIGFIVLFVPCLFIHNANWYHVATLMPLFIVVAALGFSVLWQEFPWVHARVPFVLGLFFISIFLDWTNLNKSMAAAEKEYSASNSTVWICNNLIKQGQTQGPGRVYSDFCLDRDNPGFTPVTDASGRVISYYFTSYWFPCYMTFGTYAFNTLVNQDLTPNKASWAAITTDEWAQPLLSRLFPDANLYTIKSHIPADNSLFVAIPLTPKNQSILDSWEEADRTFQESDYL